LEVRLIYVFPKDFIRPIVFQKNTPSSRIYPPTIRHADNYKIHRALTFALNKSRD